MKTYPVSFLQLGLLTGTRAIAAAGLALLLSKKATPEQAQAIGWSLLGAGSVTYLVLVADLLLQHRDAEKSAVIPP